MSFTVEPGAEGMAWYSADGPTPSPGKSSKSPKAEKASSSASKNSSPLSESAAVEFARRRPTSCRSEAPAPFGSTTSLESASASRETDASSAYHGMLLSFLSLIHVCAAAIPLCIPMRFSASPTCLTPQHTISSVRKQSSPRCALSLAKAFGPEP